MGRSRHWSFRSRTRSSTLFCLPLHRLVPRDAPSLAQGACDDGAFTIPTRTCCELVVQCEISYVKSYLVTIVFFLFNIPTGNSCMPSEPKFHTHRHKDGEMMYGRDRAREGNAAKPAPN